METRLVATFMSVVDSSQIAKNNRGQSRSSVFAAAVVRAGVEQAPVKVRNMSPNGAMVESPLTPPQGTIVSLMRGSLSARGTVAWSSDHRFGLHFASELSIKEWLATPAKCEQQRVDNIVSLIRAGAIPTEASAGAPEFDAPQSDDRLADYLGDVVRLMQDLEDDLASSDDTLDRHGLKLQNLDIAMQMIRAIAQELASEQGRETISMAKLADLRVVCTQALAKA